MSELSGMWNLNFKDVTKGAVTAIFAGIVVALASIVAQPTFDLIAVDWASVGHTVVNAAFAAFVGYLGKNLVTDQEGKVFGRL